MGDIIGQESLSAGLFTVVKRVSALGYLLLTYLYVSCSEMWATYYPLTSVKSLFRGNSANAFVKRLDIR